MIFISEGRIRLICGIVYFNNNKNGHTVNKLVKKAYKAQRTRGTMGFGFFTPNNNRLTHNTREGRILHILNRTRQSEILFHHRYPTSTGNVRNACHPFSSKNRYEHNYVMVHNGVIWNEYEVAKKQIENGISYISKQPDGKFNDSEVLLYDLADVIEGEKDTLDVEGSIAFVMVQLDKDGNRKALFFGRNTDSPLIFNKYKGGFSLTSEGEGEKIDANRLFKYDYKTKEFSSTYLYIPSYTYMKQYDYRDYDYYGSRYEDYYLTDSQSTTFSRGDYEPKAVGYNKDGKSIDIDGYIIPELSSSSLSVTETALERHKDSSMSGYIISEISNALRYDMNYCEDGAIHFGELLLDDMRNELKTLESTFEDNPSDDDDSILNSYLEIDKKIDFLSKALISMENKQMMLAIE